VGGKTLSTGQAGLSAGFGTSSSAPREAGDVLLWDAVQKQYTHVPALTAYLCIPLSRGMLQDEVHGRGGYSSHGTGVP